MGSETIIWASGKRCSVEQQINCNMQFAVGEQKSIFAFNFVVWWFVVQRKYYDSFSLIQLIVFVKSIPQLS